MTAIEIRGFFVSLLAEVEDEVTLRQMFEKCIEILKKKDPQATRFSAEMLAELDEAVAQSDDETQAISNEEAFKLFRGWANQ